MSERNEGPGRRDAGPDGGESVRDFAPGGDVGEGSHGAFANPDAGGAYRSDERLGDRGRNPARDDAAAFVDDVERDRTHTHRHDGPGAVRGLEPPEKDEVGA
jgi:hypothetical protein